MVYINVELTRIIPLLSGRYVVEFLEVQHIASSLERIIQYYSKHSKINRITFEVDNGTKQIDIEVDFLLYSLTPTSMIYHLVNNNVTGVIAEDIEEAHIVDEVIRKGYMWDLLKE